MKYIQVIISILLIIFAFRKADISRLSDSLDDIDSSFIALMILVFACQITLNIYRFTLVLRIFDPAPKFKEIFKIYISSLLAGLVFFGSVGEFLAKTYQLKKRSINLRHNISAQLLDKLIALSGLAIVASVCLIGLESEFYNLVGVSLNYVFYLAISLVLFGLIIIYLISLKFEKIRSKLENVFKLAISRNTLLCLILSIISHSLSILIAAASFSSIGISIFKEQVAAFSVPVINAISAFPLFFNGWGVREVLWQNLLVRLGYEAEQAMLGSLIIGLGLPATVLIVYFMNFLIGKCNFSSKSL